jgi:hypothetical protein
MGRPPEASTTKIINYDSSSTKNDVSGSNNSGRDFVPLSIEEYDEDDEITIEDEDYIYELDVIDNHYSNMERHLATQQGHRIRRRRCMVCSFFFVAILVAVTPSSLATLRSLIRPNHDSEGSLPDSFFPGNATITAASAAVATTTTPDEEAIEEIQNAVKVKPPASRPGNGNSISSASVASEEEQTAASTTDTSANVMECAEGEICFQVLDTIPHDTISFT